MTEQNSFNPSGCDVTQAIIRSHDGSKSVDISAQIIEFEIVQSMDSVSYNGTLLVLDTIGLLEEFPLRAEETMDLKIVGYDLNTEVNIKTHIYRVSDIVPSESNNGSVFTIHFVSNITFEASKRRVTRAYQGTIGTMAKEVFDVYFSRLDRAVYLEIDDTTDARTLPFASARYPILAEEDRNLFVQPTASISRVIVPNLTPTEAMYFLSTKGYQPETPSQTFRFFETLENYYFATDEYFVQYARRSNTKTFFYSPASSIDPRQPEDQLNRIEDLRIINKGIDTATDIFSGSYRTRVMELDLIRRTINRFDFDYSTDARYIDMSGEPRRLEDNPHTEQFRNDTFTEENAKEFIVFRDYTRNGDIPSSLHTDRFISEIIANRVSYYHHLNNTILSISLKGRLDLRPGEIISLDIKNLSGAGGVDKNDTLSGKYLIKITSHKRDNVGILNTNLQVVKFDWSRGSDNV